MSPGFRFFPKCHLWLSADWIWSKWDGFGRNFRSFQNVTCGSPRTGFGRNGMELVEISEVVRMYLQIIMSTLSTYRLVYYLVYYSLENFTQTSSCWDFNLSLRFCSQNRVKWQKNTQKCPTRSKVVEIGQKSRLCGEKKTSTNLECFLKNPKSTIGSPGLNIGRSESGEGSIFVSSTFRAQCAHF